MIFENHILTSALIRKFSRRPAWPLSPTRRDHAAWRPMPMAFTPFFFNVCAFCAYLISGLTHRLMVGSSSAHCVRAGIFPGRNWIRFHFTHCVQILVPAAEGWASTARGSHGGLPAASPSQPLLSEAATIQCQPKRADGQNHRALGWRWLSAFFSNIAASHRYLHRAFGSLVLQIRGIPPASRRFFFWFRAVRCPSNRARPEWARRAG
jgi:hypothetical protein